MVRSALLRASPDDSSHRRANHAADGRAASFETPRKHAAPPATTAKPLRGDEEKRCCPVGNYLPRLRRLLGLDLPDGIDHRIEGQHGRSMARLVVAHRFE